MIKELFSHSKNWRNWAHGIVVAFVIGGADAGYQYFTGGIKDYHQILFFAIASALLYLKKSPVPEIKTVKRKKRKK